MLVVVVGCAFGIQAAALGRPSASDLLAVRVVKNLEHYHASRTLISSGGRSFEVSCSQGWVGRQRAAIVALPGGGTLTEVANVLTVKTLRAVGEFTLAGCPRPLLKWILEQINSGRPVQSVATRVDGLPVYRLRFAGAVLHLSVDVSRTGALPVALQLSMPHGFSGSSRVRLGRAGTTGS